MMDMNQFDDNILQEILLCLPAITLMRLRRTCRRWNDLISSPYFVRTQVTRSMDNVSCGQAAYSAIDRGINACDMALIPSVNHQEFPIMADCNGLILLMIPSPNGSDRYLLGTLVPYSFSWIPEPPTIDADVGQFGLAFDPSMSPATLKIVACDMTHFSIYSPEANTWRVSKAPVGFGCNLLLSSLSPVFFNGALHWLQPWGDMVAFDVEEERCYRLKLPDGVVDAQAANGYTDAWVGVAKGRMSFVKLSSEGIRVWEMEDYSSNKWQLKKHVAMREGIGRCYYKSHVPLFYDGEMCVLRTMTRGRPYRCGLAVYRFGQGRWDRIRRFEGWVDHCRRFFPYFTSQDCGLADLVRDPIRLPRSTTRIGSGPVELPGLGSGRPRTTGHVGPQKPTSELVQPRPYPIRSP